MTAAAATDVETTDVNQPFFSLFTNAHVCAATNLYAKMFVAPNVADRRKGTPVLPR